MHAHNQLLSLVQAGKKPVITFTKAIAESEAAYVEPGMKATVISVQQIDHDVTKIIVDYSEFEAHNKPFETSDYFDKQGVPCLTAREARWYKVVDDLYLSVTLDGMYNGEPIPEVFTIDSESTNAVYAKYQSLKLDIPYVTWLENIVANHFNLGTVFER